MSNKYNLVQIDEPKNEIAVEKVKECLWFTKDNSKIEYQFSTETGVFRKYKGGEFEIPTRSSLNSWFRNCSITTDNEIVARIIIATGGRMQTSRASFPSIVEAIYSDYYSRYCRNWEGMGIQLIEVTDILENGGLDLSRLPSLPYIYVDPRDVKKSIRNYIRKQSPISIKEISDLCNMDEKDLRILEALKEKKEEEPELFEVEKHQYGTGRYETVSILDSSFKRRRLIGIISEFALDIDRFIQYLRQLKNWEHTDIEWVTNNYKDYLSAELQLRNGDRKKMDKYPSNLVQAHHNKTKIIAEIEREKRRLAEAAQREADKAIYASHKREFEYINPNEEYCMIAPKDAEEVFEEGVNQSNCVGQYTKDISDGKTAIMFMRRVKHPEKSFITVEIDLKYGLRMPQALGFANRRIGKKEKEFLERYCDNHKNSNGEEAPILYGAYFRL